MEAAVVRVQTLSQSGLQQIPSQFIQPPENRPDYSSSKPPSSDIPIIDLFNFNPQHSDDVRQELHQACKNWGAFQITNHGVPKKLLDDLRNAGKLFFNEFPMEEKLKYSCDPNSAASEGYGSRMLVRDDSVLDWRDYFDHHTLPLTRRNPNRWPSSYRHVDSNVTGNSTFHSLSELQPLCLNQQTDHMAIEVEKNLSGTFSVNIMVEYSDHMKALALKLLSLISESLCLPPSVIEDAIGEIYQNITISYYPPCPQPDLTLGLQSHSDMGGITLLIQDDVGGLQVLKDGEWVTLQPRSDAIVVILADQTEIITNGQYRSAQHRAVTNAHNARLSVAAFHDPAKSRKIYPAPKLTSEDLPARYREVVYGDYVSSWYTKGPDGKRNIDALLI